MKNKFVYSAATALMTCLAGVSLAHAGVTVFEDGDQKLSIGGKAFVNFTHSNSETTVGGVKQPDPGDDNGLAVDRFYLEAKYHANKVWMGRITMDVNNEQGNTTPGLKRNMNVFLKYAYIEGNFMPELQLRLGLSHTPWIDYEQSLWGHRYVSKVASDHFKFDDSSDYGVGLKGKVADGLIHYWATAINGGGYSNPNKTEGIDYNARVTVAPIEGLHVSGQYRYGYRGTKSGAVGNMPDKSTFYQAMITYGQKDWRVGANYLDNSKDLGASMFDVNDTAYALWGWGRMGDYGAFGRFDHNKNENAAAVPVDAKTDHVVLGVETYPVKGLTLAVAWDYTKMKNLGNTVGDEGKSNKFGLYSEYKF